MSSIRLTLGRVEDIESKPAETAEDQEAEDGDHQPQDGLPLLVDITEVGSAIGRHQNIFFTDNSVF